MKGAAPDFTKCLDVVISPHVSNVCNDWFVLYSTPPLWRPQSQSTGRELEPCEQVKGSTSKLQKGTEARKSRTQTEQKTTKRDQTQEIRRNAPPHLRQRCAVRLYAEGYPLRNGGAQGPPPRRTFPNGNTRLSCVPEGRRREGWSVPTPTPTFFLTNDIHVKN